MCVDVSLHWRGVWEPGSGSQITRDHEDTSDHSQITRDHEDTSDHSQVTSIVRSTAIYCVNQQWFPFSEFKEKSAGGKKEVAVHC